MCVAILKPQGANLPTLETLTDCFTSNPDGAGFSVWRKDSNKVEYHKGYMKFSSFSNALKKANIKESDVAMLHFRIGTSGGKARPALTHPFPISSDYKKQKKLHGECDAVLVHNGVFSIDPEKKYVSDTMTFTKELAKIMKTGVDSKFIEWATVGNRVAILTGDGKIRRYGEWKRRSTKTDSCLYSNLAFEWKSIITRYPYYGKYCQSEYDGNVMLITDEAISREIGDYYCSECGSSICCSVEAASFKEGFACPYCGSYLDTTIVDEITEDEYLKTYFNI